jgi:hypothetical protein
MRRIKEVLRLEQVLGLSEAALARGARVARWTVKQYLDRATAAGLSWETAKGLIEEELALTRVDGHAARQFARFDTRRRRRAVA